MSRMKRTHGVVLALVGWGVGLLLIMEAVALFTSLAKPMTWFRAWMPLLFGALVFTPWEILFLRWLLTTDAARKRRERNECPTCGYCLTGNVSGTCPECGTPVCNLPRHRSPSTR